MEYQCQHTDTQVGGEKKKLCVLCVSAGIRGGKGRENKLKRKTQIWILIVGLFWIP